jgi:aminopeptidase N
MAMRPYVVHPRYRRIRVQRSRWFDEAFASYFQALAVRRFQGEEAFQQEMESDRETFRHRCTEEPKSASTPIADYGREELGDNSYTKGAWSLYVLNMLLGDEKFQPSIRQFLDEFSARPAGFSDFQAVVEKVSGRHLARYFSEWIYGTESTKLLLDKLPVEQMVQRCR